MSTGGNIGEQLCDITRFFLLKNMKIALPRMSGDMKNLKIITERKNGQMLEQTVYKAGQA